MKRGLWFVFVVLVLGVGLFFTCRAALALKEYYSLKQSAVATFDTLQIVERKRDHFAIQAHFSFLYNGEKREGSAFLKGHLPNRYAAEKRLEHLEKEGTVYFNQRNIDHAVLERSFPYKQLFYALSLLGLALYFFALGYFGDIKQTWKRL